ncbi:hypothetical protein CCH79_00009999 [Gambusia affinis]|uniref:Uncharacterized protein n=1 Tax=Gambusia affinis TaxID=33528 RepID=A0A315VNV1_GAMAF|nr:hypothetical protein CCH79_00009999 [Gambusia affinis]
MTREYSDHSNHHFLAGGCFRDPAHNPLDAIHPDLQLHFGVRSERGRYGVWPPTLFKAGMMAVRRKSLFLMYCVGNKGENRKRLGSFGIKPTSSHAPTAPLSSSISPPHPGAANAFLCVRLVDIKLIRAKVPPPPYFGRSVLAGSPTSGRHVQPAIMPPLFPCHIHCSLGSFEGAAGAGRRLMQRGRGAAATQQGCGRHLANFYKLLRVYPTSSQMTTGDKHLSPHDPANALLTLQQQQEQQE